MNLGALRLPTRWRRGVPAAVGGTVRLDRRTKRLTKRLRPGDIAVIHHSDLDRVSAEALVRSGVSAVVNAVPSVSGRYPNLGPASCSTPASRCSTTSARSSSTGSTRAAGWC